jgi:hypothetical protein
VSNTVVVRNPCRSKGKSQSWEDTVPTCSKGESKPFHHHLTRKEKTKVSNAAAFRHLSQQGRFSKYLSQVGRKETKCRTQLHFGTVPCSKGESKLFIPSRKGFEDTVSNCSKGECKLSYPTRKEEKEASNAVAG